MTERCFEKSKPNNVEGSPQIERLGITHFPHRKGPVLYIGNEYCATALVTLRSDEQAEMLMNVLTDFFNIKDKP